MWLQVFCTVFQKKMNQSSQKDRHPASLVTGLSGYYRQFVEVKSEEFLQERLRQEC